MDRMAEMQREVAGLIRDGRLRHRESIVEGLEQAPEALAGVLAGATIGKTLVRIA
jgi:NADPH-dependent curcumin reductase CurA